MNKNRLNKTPSWVGFWTARIIRVPADFEGLQVPDVLLSGNHQTIRHWRLEQSLLRTLRRRPDLFKQYTLNDEEQAIIDDYLTKKDNHGEGSKK